MARIGEITILALYCLLDVYMVWPASHAVGIGAALIGAGALVLIGWG